MKVIVDNKIPFIKEAIGKIADEVIYVSGKDFTPALVKDADALIIRTRTHCNRELLQGSRVQFIATATIGFDHIDTEYCREAGITWTNAPGCNSASVAQYLQSTLLLINLLKGKNLSEMTIGIVGVGNVGIKVAKVARELGMRVLLNDLPREEKEGSTDFCSLQFLAEECDVITFHVPLYKEGKYKTFLCQHFGIQADYHIVPPEPENSIISATTETEVYLQMYDPRRDSEALKQHPELFEKLRGDYPLRREKSAFSIVTP